MCMLLCFAYSHLPFVLQYNHHHHVVFCYHSNLLFHQGIQAAVAEAAAVSGAHVLQVLLVAVVQALGFVASFALLRLVLRADPPAPSESALFGPAVGGGLLSAVVLTLTHGRPSQQLWVTLLAILLAAWAVSDVLVQTLSALFSGGTAAPATPTKKVNNENKKKKE